MSETVQQLAILYADVSGSTHIYETYGDKVARQNVETCLAILTRVADDNEGRVVKTIGDEVMCAFTNPVKCAIASRQMHEALRDASANDEFSIGEVHVKIGWHYGVVRYRGEEIVGEAPITAQQIINLAKADEILTSEHSLELLPEEFRDNSPLIDTVEAESGTGEIRVRGILWEEEDADATRFGVPSMPADDTVHKSLVLEYDGKQVTVDETNTHCKVGRGSDNDLCIHGVYTSKLHAEVSFRHGIFHLVDVSTNGTGVYFANGRAVRLHREEEILSGEGTIYFGGTPSNDPEAAVSFHCQKHP